MTTGFRTERRIRFSDCHPAGIVFCPQYFVLFNGALEDWVDSAGPAGGDRNARTAVRKLRC